MNRCKNCKQQIDDSEMIFAITNDEGEMFCDSDCEESFCSVAFTQAQIADHQDSISDPWEGC